MSYLLQVQVKPGSKWNKIEKESQYNWTIRVKERAQEGKANKAIIAMIAEELGLPVRKVKIKKGETFRIKLIEVDSDE